MIESAVCNNPKIILICFFNKWEWWWINRLVESPWLGGSTITTFAIKKLYTPRSYIILVTSEGLVRILSYLKSVLTCTLKIWTSFKVLPKQDFEKSSKNEVHISNIHVKTQLFMYDMGGSEHFFFNPRRWIENSQEART